MSEAEARRYSPDWQMFLNLNTREDFERWRSKGPDLGCNPHRVAELG